MIRPPAARFDITVAASPSGNLNIEHELQLVKAGLLYGDTVNVLSPVISMSRSAVAPEPLSLRDQMARDARLFAKKHPPLAAEAQRYVDEYDRLSGLGWRTVSERQRWADFQAMEAKYQSEAPTAFAEILKPMQELAGLDALRAAEKSGVLTVIEYLDIEIPFQEDPVRVMMLSHLDLLLRILTDDSTYPLFDDFSNMMTKAAEIDGIYSPTLVSAARGKQVGAAAHFLRRLPTFPDASVDEILDVRRELNDPLGRFRAGMSGFASEIEGAPYDAEFSALAEEFARSRVDPAMQEIEERLKDNSIVHHLVRKGAGSLQSTAPVLTMGISHLADLPLALGPALAALEVIFQSILARRDEQKNIERHQLYFLYRANALLH